MLQHRAALLVDLKSPRPCSSQWATRLGLHRATRACGARLFLALHLSDGVLFLCSVHKWMVFVHVDDARVLAQVDRVRFTVQSMPGSPPLETVVEEVMDIVSPPFHLSRKGSRDVSVTVLVDIRFSSSSLSCEQVLHHVLLVRFGFLLMLSLPYLTSLFEAAIIHCCFRCRAVRPAVTCAYPCVRTACGAV